MVEGFLHLFARRSLAMILTDIADILLVTYVVYRALLVLRDTAAIGESICQPIFGLVIAFRHCFFEPFDGGLFVFR